MSKTRIAITALFIAVLAALGISTSPALAQDDPAALNTSTTAIPLQQVMNAGASVDLTDIQYTVSFAGKTYDGALGTGVYAYTGTLPSDIVIKADGTAGTTETPTIVATDTGKTWDYTRTLAELFGADAATNFPQAGMYEFTISGSHSGGSSGDADKWTYGNETYTLQVVIKNTIEEGVITGREYAGWTLLDSEGAKVNSSDENQNGKATFTATYSGTTSLNVTKQVEGDYASTIYAFPQEITLYLPDWAADVDNISATGGQSGQWATSEGPTRTYTVNLAHGETVSFANVPVGTRYKIDEKSLTDVAQISYDANIEWLVDDGAFNASFNANGGEGSMPEMRLSAGATAPACGFTPPANKVFASWNTQADGNGTPYAEGDALPAGANLELFAIWVPSPTAGAAYAVLDDAGKLTLFRSENAYNEGPDQTVEDIRGNSYTGRVYTDIETSPSRKWNSETSSIISVDIADSQIIMPASTYSWFDRCNNLTTCDLNGLNTSNVANMGSMFNRCSSLTSLDISGFDTSKVTDMSSMFEGCSSLTSLDVSGFDTLKVTSMYSMFDSCSKLTSLDVSGFDTSNVTNMKGMFYYCSALTSLDVSGFDTSNVTNMRNMFYGCSKLTSLDVSGFDTSKVTDMSFMFYDCSSLSNLDVSGFNTSNVTDMNAMFHGCSLFTNLNVSGFDTSKVTDMSSMFYGCSKLTSLDVSGFDTSNVTNMSDMFGWCKSLTSLNVSAFDTSNVTNMADMFQGCELFTNLNVADFDTSNVKCMRYMFASCSNLANLDVSGFDTSNVTNMHGVFFYCKSLTSLDVSGFDTSKVTDMEQMFDNCSKLTSLDVSGFDTSNVKSMSYMFSGCSSLQVIYANATTNWSANSALMSSMNMFSSCTRLKGGDNTAFDSSKTDKTYARVDGLNNQPGYFTAKQ